MQAHHSAQASEIRRTGHAVPGMVSRSASFDQRTRAGGDSWIEVASQPSSSSLSSAAGDDALTAQDRRVKHDPRSSRRRHHSFRHNRPATSLNIEHRPFLMGGTSSQEEYEESESESDRVMTSSGEIPHHQEFEEQGARNMASTSPHVLVNDPDDDAAERRTAINHPLRNNDNHNTNNAETCFTPQPNAFSHPPSSNTTTTTARQPVPGSYFPATSPHRPHQRPQASTRHSLPAPQNPSHYPQNILSPSYNAAAQHEEVLRASLTTLLSCAAAARGLPKSESKASVGTTSSQIPRVRGNGIQPMTLRLVPESQLPQSKTSGQTKASPTALLQEPSFRPTLRRPSTSTASSTHSTSPEREQERLKETKRKSPAVARTSSRERRSPKKARRSTSAASVDDYAMVSPTLLTWVVSAGVVVVLSALSFSAGYGMGKEAGRLEAGEWSGGGGGGLRGGFGGGCAKEAGRSSLGLRRSLAQGAVVV